MITLIKQRTAKTTKLLPVSKFSRYPQTKGKNIPVLLPIPFAIPIPLVLIYVG